MKKNNQKKIIGTTLIDCLIIVALTVLLYYPVINYPFHNWDDGVYIYKNEKICKGLTFETIKWAFNTNYFGFYYPLTWMSHALDVSLYGLSPKGHYSTNILFHSMNSLLVYIFFLISTNDRVRSIIVSLIFALHPLNVESVAWLAERKNLLATFFLLASFISYYFYVKIDKASYRKMFYFIVTFILFSFGLMAKSSIVMFPLLLILFDIWPFKRFILSSKKELRFFLNNILKEKSLFFVISVFFGIITINAQKQLKAVISFQTIPFSHRIGESLLSLWFYLKKYFFPFNLSAFYEHHKGDYPFWMPLTIFLAYSFIIFAFAKAFKKNSALLIGLIFFVVSLMPVLGFIQAGLQGRADRYVYFPYLGLSILTVFGLINDKLIRKKYLITSVIVFISLYFFFTSSKQIKVWENDRTLFENVVKIQPKSFLGYLKLGNYYYLNLKDYDKALEYYLKALSYNDREPLIYCNIGTLYYLKKDYNNSLSFCDKATAIDPNYSEAYYRKGLVYLEMGAYEKALDAFLEAKKLGFELEEVNEKLSKAEKLLKKGKLPE